MGGVFQYDGVGLECGSIMAVWVIPVCLIKSHGRHGTAGLPRYITSHAETFSTGQTYGSGIVRLTTRMAQQYRHTPRPPAPTGPLSHHYLHVIVRCISLASVQQATRCRAPDPGKSKAAEVLNKQRDGGRIGGLRSPASRMATKAEKRACTLGSYRGVCCRVTLVDVFCPLF